MRTNGRVRAISVFVALLSGIATPPAWAETVEIKDLIVDDTTGTLSTDQLKTMAGQVQSTLERVVAFWTADPQTGRFGKIRVVLDMPGMGGYSSVFYWEGRDWERRRVVRVFGFERTPQMAAHKLTSAIFPQKDKLIRNMMGVLTEARVGNPLTFPMCGLDVDDWVSASVNAKSYLPVAELGSDHESWGMRFSGGGRVSIFDRKKQHTAYAEAGSFGAYLYRSYGIDRIKRLQRLSQGEERPFRAAFGASVEELEASWLAALKESEESRRASVATAARLLAEDPLAACREARIISTKGR